MITINILCCGKIKENFFNGAIDEYSKRLNKYCNLNIIEISDEKVPDKLNSNLVEEIKNKEADKMLAKLGINANNKKLNTYLISCDLNGKNLSSEEFSEHIEKIALNGNSNITFVIGGTLGIGKEVLDLANEKLCFSKMTFPHQLMRVILLEQLFRAFKISKGETYHR